MSGLFNKASLVLVPSGYKSGKVYSQVPTNGDGDLSFTRSNDTATRVNSAGLIEKVRTNLVTYSEEFDDADWSRIGTTVTANNITAPNGTLTADRINASGGASSTHYIQSNIIAFTAGVTYSFSTYAKKGNTSIIQLLGGSAAFGLNNWATYNFDTLEITEGSTATASMVDVGDGWYRLNLTVVCTTSNSTSPIFLVFTNNKNVRLPSFVQSGETVYVWGAQAELSDFGATEYIFTTSSAVSVGMTANVPRLDYSGGGCPKLLLESQRSNLVTFSEQFNNADWGKSNAIITANDTASPDGYTNADKITDNANSTQHRVTQNISVTSGTSYTASIFVKNDDKGDFTINYTTTGFPSTKIVFNLINGTVTSGTGTIEDYGNGWYRISATAAANATGSGTIGFNLGDGGGYVGSGQSVFIWGAQIEVGSYVSSYIPTLAAASTRGQDACSKTGISSLIGQTEGTLFTEISAFTNGGVSRRISLGDGSTNNRVSLEIDEDASTYKCFMSSGGTIVGQLEFVGIDQTDNLKIALTYSDSEFSLFINGVKRDTDTTISATPIELNRLLYSNAAGSLAFEGTQKQLIIFPTALTDTQAIELTTL